MLKRPLNRDRVASFLVPALTATVLLYRVLADLQITLMRPETLVMAAGVLCGGLVVGLVAAYGTTSIRVVVLSLTAVLWLDVAFGLTRFEALTPERRAVAARDSARVKDLQTIRAGLDRYVAEVGPLPIPLEYGEAAGVAGFWDQWWDVSSEDGNGDGLYFLDFLVYSKLFPSVPVDPLNEAPPDRHPARGRQYVYFVAPVGYTYEGGTCDLNAGHATYLLGVTDLEQESERPPVNVSGSGCECLWRDKPNFFQQHFDYVTCGRADAAEPKAKDPDVR